MTGLYENSDENYMYKSYVIQASSEGYILYWLADYYDYRYSVDGPLSVITQITTRKGTEEIQPALP